MLDSSSLRVRVMNQIKLIYLILRVLFQWLIGFIDWAYLLLNNIKYLINLKSFSRKNNGILMIKTLRQVLGSTCQQMSSLMAKISKYFKWLLQCFIDRKVGLDLLERLNPKISFRVK